MTYEIFEIIAKAKGVRDAHNKLREAGYRIDWDIVPLKEKKQ